MTWLALSNGREITELRNDIGDPNKTPFYEIQSTRSQSNLKKAEAMVFFLNYTRILLFAHCSTSSIKKQMERLLYHIQS